MLQKKDDDDDDDDDNNKNRIYNFMQILVNIGTAIDNHLSDKNVT